MQGRVLTITAIILDKPNTDRTHVKKYLKCMSTKINTLNFFNNRIQATINNFLVNCCIYYSRINLFLL